MYIDVALGYLDQAPPEWLKAGLAPLTLAGFEAATRLSRRRELVWSRGLAAALAARRLTLNNDSRAALSRIRVSIAHDRYLTAVARAGGAVGIDLQSVRPLSSCYRIAKTWFPECEYREILAAKDCYRFLQSWVIKEAWAKCMQRSIFTACRAVSICRGEVRIAAAATQSGRQLMRQSGRQSVRMVWAKQPPSEDSLGSRPGRRPWRRGFAMGICCAVPQQSEALTIECWVPGSTSALQGIAMDWQPIAVQSADCGASHRTDRRRAASVKAT